jgi:hypothetical protein
MPGPGMWDAVLVDSLTLWVSAREGDQALSEFEGFLAGAEDLAVPFVLVSDEGRHRRSRPRGLRGVGRGERGPSGHVLRKAPQRLSGERGLFSGVRGRVILQNLAKSASENRACHPI